MKPLKDKTYLEIAIEAARLAGKGKTHIEVKTLLGFKYARDAQHAINIGRRHNKNDELALSAEEKQLILAVAKAERRALERGDGCSPKLKYLPGLYWSRSKVERVARNRLDLHRKGEEDLPAWQQTGLGLVNAYHGGYVTLRNAGWALVHALEAQGGKA